jgi:prolycopene isomerase
VSRLKIEHNQVQSIHLTSGEKIESAVVIANADATQVVYKLIGAEFFSKRYMARFKRMQPSCSVFVVYLATTLDLNAMNIHHEGFYYDNINHQSNYENTLASSETITWLSITVPTLVDPSLAPDGEHLMVLTRLVNFETETDWKAVKSQYVEKMLNYADGKISGLKDSIQFLEAGSPETLQRYTANTQGAAYGWAATPEQIGANRLANKAPIEGLYFAGHWSTPGGGLVGACYSGVLAAQKVLNIQPLSTFLDFLKASPPHFF